jgi:hypothetical protein
MLSSLAFKPIKLYLAQAFDFIAEPRCRHSSVALMDFLPKIPPLEGFCRCAAGAKSPEGRGDEVIAGRYLPPPPGGPAEPGEGARRFSRPFRRPGHPVPFRGGA